MRRRDRLAILARCDGSGFARGQQLVILHHLAAADDDCLHVAGFERIGNLGVNVGRGLNPDGSFVTVYDSSSFLLTMKSLLLILWSDRRYGDSAGSLTIVL